MFVPVITFFPLPIKNWKGVIKNGKNPPKREWRLLPNSDSRIYSIIPYYH